MQRLIKGVNDLQTMFPEIAAQWHQEKNGTLSPDMVVAHSSQRAWWKCERGHEWQTIIGSRTKKEKSGCPYCTGRYAAAGLNDLQSRYPEIAAEWNYGKNTLRPDQITFGSGKKVWWKCKEGHEWLASPNSRTGMHSNCPYCTKRKVITGVNDLQTKYPEIAAEWNQEKNGSLLPSQISPGSLQKVWWKCGKGHEWLAKPVCRTKDQTNCPYCAGMILIPGENDLLTKCPSVAAQWNIEKNGTLLPSQVMAGSQKKVWWKCSRGHEWQAVISSRTNEKQVGCPYCSGKRICTGYNDFQTKFPEIAEEWNYEKNGQILPEQIAAGNRRNVWWKCSKGHEWQATVYYRTSRQKTCPYCACKTLITGFNDLQTLQPDAAKWWHLERNGTLPSQINPNSQKQAWWKCPQGHEFRAKIVDMAHHRHCLYCDGQKTEEQKG